jgi:hypothetical protein
MRGVSESIVIQLAEINDHFLKENNSGFILTINMQCLGLLTANKSFYFPSVGEKNIFLCV